MKQGKQYLNLIVWIFLAAVAAYFGYSIFSATKDAYTTMTVSTYEAGAGYYATGFVVRDETVIPADSQTTVQQIAEGTHVAAGQVVATEYHTADAISRQQRIDTLQNQLEQLRYAYGSVSSASDQAAMDETISSDLVLLRKYLHRKDMSSVEDLSSELKGLVIRRTGEYDSDSLLLARMDTAQAELDTLLAQATDDTSTIEAPASGYYSSHVDGYESVLVPDALSSMTVAQLEGLAPEDTPDFSAGKLISGNTWYYVCVIPADELDNVQEGDTAYLSFARDFYQTVEMQVERVGLSEAGDSILVLSCNRYMQKLTQMRRQSAELVFAQYSGLRVPKSAVQVLDGQTGVYILENNMAKWKPITILHDNGESYVVQEDKSSTDELWAGDELILGAKGLYNGKVME